MHRWHHRIYAPSLSLCVYWPGVRDMDPVWVTARAAASGPLLITAIALQSAQLDNEWWRKHWKQTWYRIWPLGGPQTGYFCTTNITRTTCRQSPTTRSICAWRRLAFVSTLKRSSWLPQPMHSTRQMLCIFCTRIFVRLFVDCGLCCVLLPSKTFSIGIHSGKCWFPIPCILRFIPRSTTMDNYHGIMNYVFIVNTQGRQVRSHGTCSETGSTHSLFSGRS